MFKKVKHIIGRLLTENNFNLKEAFKTMESRGWDRIYVFVDIHGTVLKPDYNKIAKQYYPKSKEVLQRLSKDKRFKLILYTCSYPVEIIEYIDFFKKDGIVFDFINKNPEVINTRGGYFEDKPYMNVLLEDKAGFVGEYDWYILNYELNKYEKDN